MLLLLLCTRFCLMLDSFPKALYNSDMKSTKQEIQAIKTRLKDPTKANTKQKTNTSCQLFIITSLISTPILSSA